MPILYMPASGRSRFCVYRLINPANGLPFYVGTTPDPRDRMNAHRKGNLATPEGRARHAVVVALTGARLSVAVEIHRTFPYRGQAMAHESATIAELLDAGVPLLNTSKLALAERVAIHLNAIANHAGGENRMNLDAFGRYKGNVDEWADEQVGALTALGFVVIDAEDMVQEDAHFVFLGPEQFRVFCTATGQRAVFQMRGEVDVDGTIRSVIEKLCEGNEDPVLLIKAFEAQNALLLKRARSHCPEHFYAEFSALYRGALRTGSW